MNRRLGCFGCAVGGAIGLGVVLLGWLLFFAPVDAPVVGNARLRCSVGFAGTNASITVEGFLAGEQCRDLVDTSWGGVGQPYLVGHPTDGPVMCRFVDGLRRFTVRDNGVFVLVGTALCEVLNPDSSN